MRAIRFVTAVTMVVVALTQFGCGKSDGDQYIGKWTRVNGQDYNEIVISRNGGGNDFYISHQENKFNDEGNKVGTITRQQPATVVDGKMIVSAAIQYAMTIDKSNGHLVTPGSEFERAK
ncbi:hypothetical protein [Burkholderia sp. Ac-20353]|uniref:hypothetical protein n=1 Tax=Burkholderia sp. Ac-20353 TaxID=2703894 RepID=UPI001F11AFDE|nr:hypothetical protein [Burkholderia sp. Ac-20353]